MRLASLPFFWWPSMAAKMAAMVLMPLMAAAAVTLT
jgi:hypothetical protein